MSTNNLIKGSGLVAISPNNASATSLVDTQFYVADFTVEHTADRIFAETMGGAKGDVTLGGNIGTTVKITVKDSDPLVMHTVFGDQPTSGIANANKSVDFAYNALTGSSFSQNYAASLASLTPASNAEIGDYLISASGAVASSAVTVQKLNGLTGTFDTPAVAPLTLPSTTGTTAVYIRIADPTLGTVTVNGTSIVRPLPSNLLIMSDNIRKESNLLYTFFTNKAIMQSPMSLSGNTTDYSSYELNFDILQNDYTEKFTRTNYRSV